VGVDASQFYQKVSAEESKIIAMKGIFAIFVFSIFFSSICSVQSDDDDVFFMLYTRENPVIGKRIELNSESVIESNWNAANDVRILVHGYWASYSVIENVLTTAELLRRRDYNVIGELYEQFCEQNKKFKLIMKFHSCRLECDGIRRS
jgi:hypothetical protein